MGAERRRHARRARPGQQARFGQAHALRPGARPLGHLGRRRLRAGGAGRHLAGRHAAQRGRGVAGAAQPDAGLRAARSRPAARSRSGAGHAGRRRDGQPRRLAPRVGRCGARPSAGLQRRQWPRRDLQVGRQGDEERHRLRSFQASGRLLGHARRARRGLGESPARARPDAHAAAARPRRRRCREGDVRCHGQPARRLGRRPCRRQDGAAPRRRGALGRGASEGTARIAGGIGRENGGARHARKPRLLARGARRGAARGGGRRHRVEDLLPADRRAGYRRPHQGAAACCRGVLRLVGRPDLARLAGERRRRPRNRARRARPCRRPCHFDPRCRSPCAPACRSSSLSRRRSPRWPAA